MTALNNYDANIIGNIKGQAFAQTVGFLLSNEFQTNGQLEIKYDFYKLYCDILAMISADEQVFGFLKIDFIKKQGFIQEHFNQTSGYSSVSSANMKKRESNAVRKKKHPYQLNGDIDIQLNDINTTDLQSFMDKYKDQIYSNFSMKDVANKKINLICEVGCDVINDLEKKTSQLRKNIFFIETCLLIHKEYPDCQERIETILKNHGMTSTSSKQNIYILITNSSKKRYQEEQEQLTSILQTQFTNHLCFILYIPFYQTFEEIKKNDLILTQMGKKIFSEDSSLEDKILLLLQKNDELTKKNDELTKKNDNITQKNAELNKKLEKIVIAFSIAFLLLVFLLYSKP